VLKTFIVRLLASVGLAPSSHVAMAASRARDAAAKAGRLEERLAKLRGDVDLWKQRQQETAGALAEAKKTAARAGASTDSLKADLARVRAEADDSKARAETLAAQVRDLRERLEESRRAATVAREHLMATEVKLDLIEAAIQVLDTRTREAALPHS
jgi:chromosome segregation ATPase